MSVLFLTIKKVWFDKIANGEKNIEYREFKEYYHNKFKKQYDTILLQNGYSKKSPRLQAKIIKIDIGDLENDSLESDFLQDKEKWYRIHLGDIEIIQQ